LSRRFSQCQRHRRHRRLTRDAASAARAAADHIPRVERAYLFGGGPGRLRDQQGVPVPDKGWVSVGNYGRTPAVLTRVEWGFCGEIEFPTNRPVSQLLDRNLLPDGTVHSLQKDDVYRPGANPSLIEGTDFHIAENVGKIFFGRLTYRILFDDAEHFSTFKLKIGPNGQSSGLPGCYSDWS
jgi:hypothetical protein